MTVGCDAGPHAGGEPAYDGPEVAIDVAALDLPNVSDAAYRLTVRNGAGEEVWRREVSSGDFGDGHGSIAYVGPCDAESNPNTVELELLDLYAGGSALSATTYVNPAPSGQPLALPFQCAADRDVAVTFNLTILRSAEQGFFDVAVNFNDVFCSAKFDCRDDAGQPIELLPNPFNAYAREMTVVFAFACTADPDVGGSTALYVDDLIITCDDQTWTIDPSGGPGNLEAPALSPTPTASSYVYGAAVYRGEQDVDNQLFWNVAIGLEPDAFAQAGTCVLSTRATAADEDLGHLTPPLTTYPYMEWNVTLSDGAGLTCSQHALDGGDGMVSTHYTGVTTQRTFAHELQFVDLGAIPTAPGPPDSVKLSFSGVVGGLDEADVYRLSTKGGAEVVWHDVVFERRAGSTDVHLAIYTEEPGDSVAPVATLTGSAVSIAAADLAPAIEHPLPLWVVTDSVGAPGTYSFDVWLCTEQSGCVAHN